MKVLFFFGGMPHYLISLLNSINRSGVEVYVIIPESGGMTLGKGVLSKKDGIQFNTIKLPEYKAWYGKPFFRRTIKSIKEIQPDIIVLGWPYILTLFFNPYFSLFLKLNKIKVILKEIPFQVPPFKSPVSYLKQNPIMNENLELERTSGLYFYLNTIALKWIRKYYYSFVDATLNYCDKAINIQSGYGVSVNSIYISHNTPDTDLLFEAKKKIRNDKPSLAYNPHRIIHLGRLVKWKRVDLILKAIARLKDYYPEVELVIVGKGPEEESLRTLAGNLQISERIKWVGAKYDYEDLGQYFNASSVYVLAGMGGLSINEAMAFHKPVVCSIADGTEKKLVREGYNGLFFKEGDYESLCDALSYLFSNPYLMEDMGKNSEKIIHEEINLNTVTYNYLNCFKAVIDPKTTK